MSDTVARMKLTETTVSAKTRWLFVELVTRDGLTGLGEATLQGREAMVRDAADRFAPTVLGKPVPSAAHRPSGVTLAEAACLSAFDQALHDIAARRAGTERDCNPTTSRRARRIRRRRARAARRPAGSTCAT